SGANQDAWITMQGRLCTYSLNNVYYNDARWGQIFEKGQSNLASIEDTVGTVFCAGGNRFQAAQAGGGAFQLNMTTSPPSITSAQASFLARHQGGMNAIFFDGHAKWMNIQELGKSRVDPSTNKIYFPYFTKTLD